MLHFVRIHGGMKTFSNCAAFLSAHHSRNAKFSMLRVRRTRFRRDGMEMCFIYRSYFRIWNEKINDVRVLTKWREHYCVASPSSSSAVMDLVVLWGFALLVWFIASGWTILVMNLWIIRCIWINAGFTQRWLLSFRLNITGNQAGDISE